MHIWIQAAKAEKMEVEDEFYDPPESPVKKKRQAAKAGKREVDEAAQKEVSFSLFFVSVSVYLY